MSNQQDSFDNASNIIATSGVYSEPIERRSARDFFLQEESKLMDSFISSSRKVFEQTGRIFQNHYLSMTMEEEQGRGGQLRNLIRRCNQQFEAYAVQRKKVKSNLMKIDDKKDYINNFATMINKKNTLNRFFSAWKAQKEINRRIKKMHDLAETHNQKRLMRSVLKQWNKVMMQENRAKIKNTILHKTEIEVTRIQKEYEKAIEEMERKLNMKLIELQKEEEEHKLLHDKYEAMYSRKKVQEPAS